MKHIVGVADMAVSNLPGDVIVTHALGSCLGISAYDPVSRVGGLLHVMMPLSSVNPDKARQNPFMFVDTGIPAFMARLFQAGLAKGRMIIKVAGGANVHDANDRFVIGKRNLTILKKLLWKNSVLIDSEDTGGSHPRTMYLDVTTGRVWLTTAGVEKEL